MTETVRDVPAAGIARDADADLTITLPLDAGNDLPISIPDAGIDSGSPCGVCPLDLTCGGGGDPLRCGITVTTQAGKVCSPDGWCWISPKPQGNDLNAVYATSASDGWAVGQAGTVLHYDGSDWSGTAGLLRRQIVDPEISGAIANGEDFAAVWASGPGDAWIATRGSSPLALQGDGNHWNRVVIPAATAFSILVDVWGSGPGITRTRSDRGSNRRARARQRLVPGRACDLRARGCRACDRFCEATTHALSYCVSV